MTRPDTLRYLHDRRLVRRFVQGGCIGIAIILGASSASAQELRIEPTGRLHLDYAIHDADERPLDDNAIIRRARLGVKGEIGNDVSFEAGYDFANGGSFTSVSATYEAWKGTAITIGQFKVPFGFEENTSSNETTFIERSLPTQAFPQGRRLGLGVTKAGDSYTVVAMGFGKSIDGDEGRGAGARFTFTPINRDETVFHLGVAVTTENPRSDEAQFDPRPESAPTEESFVDTGDLEAVRRINQFGLEVAWKRGPLSVQAEWMRASVNRGSGRRDVDFNGWYVAGSWIITGETREYEGGSFGGVSSERRVGAWELAARVSRIDLDDRTTQGGKERNVTLGLNWYANDHLRIMANAIKVRSERRGVTDNPSILLLRTQFSF